VPDRRNMLSADRTTIRPVSDPTLSPWFPMLYRPPLRSSRAARWSRRLGGLAVPLVIITLIAHRLDLVATPEAIVLAGIAFCLGLVAIVAALVGLAVVWERGFEGARNAAFGLIYATLALSPAIYGGYAAATNPALSDISTDWANPPLYVEAQALRGGHLNGVAPPSPDRIELQQRVYPDIATRHFGIGSEQLFRSVKKVVERNGWKILGETVPKEDGERGRIEAVARTPVFGEENDVVIRILAEPAGAKIDMRSSSRYGSHDLGQNAARIRSFFTALEAAVAENFGQ